METGKHEAPGPAWTAGELAELEHHYGTRWQIIRREFADGPYLEAQARPGRLGPRLVRPDVASLREGLDREAAVSGICDLPLTEAGRAAVERHRAALADGNLQEWRDAYPAMAGAVTEAYVRLRRQAVLAETASGENPSTAQGRAAAGARRRS